MRIRDNEVEFRFSRSSGPGGQNVNKVSSRVTVFFDVVGSGRFGEDEKRRILRKLAGRANKEGVIHVASERHRRQRANREAAMERLGELLGEALRKEKPRRKTKVPARAKRKRLEEKKKRSELKKQRGQRDFEY
jgi:ribosome-associated protein